MSDERGKILKIVPKDKDEAVPGFLRSLATYCEKNDIKSVAVVIASKDDDCDYSNRDRQPRACGAAGAAAG